MSSRENETKGWHLIALANTKDVWWHGDSSLCGRRTAYRVAAQSTNPIRAIVKKFTYHFDVANMCRSVDPCLFRSGPRAHT